MSSLIGCVKRSEFCGKKERIDLMAVDSLEDYSMESVDFHPLPQPPKVYPALIALFVSDGGAIEIDIHEVIKGITNEGTILSNLLADWVEYAHKKMEERI